MMDYSYDINQVESHLTWITKLLSTDRKLATHDAKLDHVWKQLDNCRVDVKAPSSSAGSNEAKEEKPPRVEEDVDNNAEMQIAHKQVPKWPSYLALLLNHAAMSVYSGDLDGATEQLANIRGVIGDLKGDHRERLYEVTTYFVDALKWSIGRLKYEEKEEEDDEQVIEKDSDEDSWELDDESAFGDDDELLMLNTKWNSFRSFRVKREKARAVILFFKHQLEKSLLPDYKLETQMDILQKVVDSDPNYHIWYHYAVETKRKLRLLATPPTESEVTTTTIGPSQDEIEWSWMAYELNPTIVLTNFDWGMILKEILELSIESREKFFEGRYKYYMLETPESVDVRKGFMYLEKALTLAKKHKLDGWVNKIRTAKQELLLGLDKGDTYQLEDLELLLACLKSYPNDAIVHQKLGRLYSQGVNVNGKIENVNTEKGGMYFKWALELLDSDLDEYLSQDALDKWNKNHSVVLNKSK